MHISPTITVEFMSIVSGSQARSLARDNNEAANKRLRLKQVFTPVARCVSSNTTVPPRCKRYANALQQPNAKIFIIV